MKDRSEPTTQETEHALLILDALGAAPRPDRGWGVGTHCVDDFAWKSRITITFDIMMIIGG